MKIEVQIPDLKYVQEKFLLTPYWNTLLLSCEDCQYVFENLYSLSLIFVWNT